MTFPSIVIIPFWEGSKYLVPFNHSFTNNNQKKDRAYKKKKKKKGISADNCLSATLNCASIIVSPGEGKVQRLDNSLPPCVCTLLPQVLEPQSQRLLTRTCQPDILAFPDLLLFQHNYPPDSKGNF